MTNATNYVEDALRTRSNNFHGDLVAKHRLIAVLEDAITELNTLDVIKKALFYGKKSVIDAELPTVTLPTSEVLNESQVIDVIHAIIGKATEAGELLELLHKWLTSSGDVDLPNLIEEIGDGQWYDAIAVAAIDTTFEKVQAINIAKLRARFPEKFTEHNAQNRDLVTERKILEG